MQNKEEIPRDSSLFAVALRGPSVRDDGGGLRAWGGDEKALKNKVRLILDKSGEEWAIIMLTTPSVMIVNVQEGRHFCSRAVVNDSFVVREPM